ncbi:hypothetical protein CCP3SC5AM1_30044 [Gammaproteobacteria bacterium]
MAFNSPTHTASNAWALGISNLVRSFSSFLARFSLHGIKGFFVYQEQR